MLSLFSSNPLDTFSSESIDEIYIYIYIERVDSCQCSIIKILKEKILDPFVNLDDAPQAKINWMNNERRRRRSWWKFSAFEFGESENYNNICSQIIADAASSGFSVLCFHELNWIELHFALLSKTNKCNCESWRCCICKLQLFFLCTHWFSNASSKQR